MDANTITFPRNLTDDDWAILLEQIEGEACVPFLGSGFSPWQFKELIQQWAGQCGLLAGAKYDLARMAQYLRMRYFPNRPKQLIANHFKAYPPPDFADRADPYVYLAELPIRLYVTTNYDDYMYQALVARVSHDKDPRRGLAAWADGQRKARSVPFPKPSVAQPVVYHLHGYVGEPPSMVVAEDDYLAFLQSIYLEDHDDPDAQVIDPDVSEVLSTSSWLLLGYRLEDWDFRILLRVLDRVRKVNSNMHIAAQLPMDNMTAEMISYLDSFFKNREVKIFWGSVEQFLAELRRKRDR